MLSWRFRVRQSERYRRELDQNKVKAKQRWSPVGNENTAVTGIPPRSHWSFLAYKTSALTHL